MPHHMPLMGTIVAGFVADVALANELAEIGVILLMFEVGLHFSLRDVLSVKNIAVPGAVIQIAAATALGLGLALYLGWSVAAGLVFGLALSVASTVVLLRVLQARNLVETERGRIAVGWLIVEDLAMILALVLLPALGGVLDGGEGADGGESLPAILGLTVLKAGREVVIGNATSPRTMDEAGIDHATKLIIAIPEGYEGGVIAEHARKRNPNLVIFARAHSDDEVAYLEKLGVDHVIMGEREIARAILGLATTSPAAT